MNSNGNKAPGGNVGRWATAGLSFDRLPIKEIVHSDFIPSWKVSKGPPVMPLILSPSGHI